MLAANLEERARLSAEYNGLFCFYGGRFAPDDQHWLLATDTWLGRQTANILEEVLGATAQTKHITDLRTEDLQAFRLAMAELVRICDEEIKPLGMHVVFNLTGGFKSVQGFMQALGMLYADETIYVFESSKELLRLPRLPLRLDAEAKVRDSLRVFQRLEARLPVTHEASGNMPDMFLFEVDGQVTLSEWGELVWRQTREALLEERIWPPIDEKIRYGAEFERSTSDCTAEQRRLINERLAELARHLHDPSYNPRRLDFKKLAVPHGISTHECDAWAHGDAKRLFGHFENDTYILDKLDKGLH